MDNISISFIESVYEICGGDLAKRAKELPDRWGDLAEAYLEYSGSVELRYSLHNFGPQCRLYYKLNGFPHIENRRLSPEVVKQMSDCTRSIRLTFEEYLEDPDEWICIDPEGGEDDAAIQLLMDLDAPWKILHLQKNQFVAGLGPNCVEMVTRYPRLLRTFTTIELATFTEPAYVQFVQDAVATGRVESVGIYPPMGKKELVPAVLPTSFWIDYFFSESCQTLHVHFKDLDVPLGVIDRWQKTDPRTLTPSKLLSGFRASEKALEEQGVDMTTILLSDADPKVRKIIERTPPASRVTPSPLRASMSSLRYICHPVDPSSRIYFVFRRSGECSLLLP
uniref:F-box domain-containing protein n=1 Tax=Steinernema glaseri TaxID=37863 RepID=A0A1I7YSI7_9BILA